jgi:hypothetical protein
MEKITTRLLLLIGVGFTPDRLILQGKSHQFIDLRPLAANSFLTREAGDAENC